MSVYQSVYFDFYKPELNFSLLCLSLLPFSGPAQREPRVHPGPPAGGAALHRPRQGHHAAQGPRDERRGPGAVHGREEDVCGDPSLARNTRAEVSRSLDGETTLRVILGVLVPGR